MPAVNADHSTPLYRQVADELRSEIEEGVYREGDRIASESELCKKFEVSRITVRQAIQELANEGFLERSQGKGTFVAKRRFISRLLHLTSFSEVMLAEGWLPESKTIQIVKEKADKPIAKKLRIKENDDVLLFTRLRLSEMTPLLLVSSYYPYSMVSKVIDAIASSTSVFQVLESRLGIRAVKVQQTIELAYATRFEALHLDVRPHTPVFLIKGVIIDAKGRPMEYFKSVSRPDRVEFFAELER